MIKAVRLIELVPEEKLVALARTERANGDTNGKEDEGGSEEAIE